MSKRPALNLSLTPARLSLLFPTSDKSYALGKWHLGYTNASYTPTHRGFSNYLGYYSGAEEHFNHIKTSPSYPKGCGILDAYDLANNTGLDGPITNADKSLLGDDGKYSVHLYGNESVRYIRAHDPDVPLYMYIAWNVVHAPCEAPSHYTERHSHIADLGRRQFAGMMSSLDEALPLIVTALKEKDMWSNCIFIVTTDNGGNLGGSGNNWRESSSLEPGLSPPRPYSLNTPFSLLQNQPQL